MKPIERKLEKLKLDLLVRFGKPDGIAQPRRPHAQVVFTMLTKSGVKADGKGSAAFFPPFCQALRRHGLATYFLTTEGELAHHLGRKLPTILVNIFGEDHHDIRSPVMTAAEGEAAMVFNSSQMGAILADKIASLEHLTTAGVPMPPQPTADRPTFSNERLGTTRPIKIVDPGEHADEDRYNRALIDTTCDFADRSYYTCVRLMCVGNHILHAMVRARPVDQENPSVHTKNTPLDPDLLHVLQKTLIEDRFEVYQQIADQMYAAAGPGFFAHDVLVARDKADVFLCESGYKFDEFTFCDHIRPIRDALPFHQGLFPLDHYAEKAADAFIDLMVQKGIKPT